MRALHLSNPLMHGPDVRAAQVVLNKHGYLGKIDIDGAFGSHSAQASELAKFRLGYPGVDIKPTYGDVLNNFLKGTTPLPKDYKERQQARLGVAFTEFETLAVRHKIVTVAQWGIHNAAHIHYSHRRPIEGTNHPYELPLYIDCSGFVTLCYEWAGAPDPNGRGFDGLGYTGTLLQHMKPIMRSQVQIADLVVFGHFPGHHVGLVIGGGTSDPILGSHGQENDPREIRYSVEQRYQSYPATWLTLRAW